MNQQPGHRYNEDELCGLSLGRIIISEWESGRYADIAELTTAIQTKKPELPRSVIFWLAYHTITELSAE